MAYLGKYIREILEGREPVILPGFGSLIVEEGKGAAGAEGRIDPPGAMVRFDATHPKGDGKLAETYAEGEGLDPEEARQQVLELVDAIRFKLDKGEQYKLEGVGTFTRDDDNKVWFKKDPAWEIDPDLFGLDPLEILELEPEPEEEKVSEGPGIHDGAAREQTDGSEVQTKATGKKDVELTGKEPQQRLKRKPVNKWTIIWIVTGSLIAVLVIILLIPAGNGIEFGKEGIILRDDDRETEQRVKVTPGRERADRQQVDDRQPEVGVTGDEETVAGIKDGESGPRFYIIAGSFQNLANATQLHDQLKTAGFPAEIIITENRMYRVSIKSYTKKAKALDEVSEIREQSGISGAWVLTR